MNLDFQDRLLRKYHLHSFPGQHIFFIEIVPVKMASFSDDANLDYTNTTRVFFASGEKLCFPYSVTLNSKNMPDFIGYIYQKLSHNIKCLQFFIGKVSFIQNCISPG